MVRVLTLSYGAPANGDTMTDDTPAGSTNETRKEVPSSGILAILGRTLYNYFVGPLVMSRKPPWFDARGVAVGLFVGFGVPFGGQVMMLALLRLAFRFNWIIAFGFTWVTNPFSIIPMYYGYYRLGSLILNRPPVLTSEKFTEIIMPLLSMDYFWESLQGFAALGGDFMLRWFAAGLTIGILTAVVSYFVAHRFQSLRCRRRAKKMGLSYDRLLKDLETRLHIEEDSEEEEQRKVS
ncbi:DUF2062 domain-containing protein [Thermodesulfobacteriota bacterium]